MDQPEVLFISSSFSLNGRYYRGISQRLAQGMGMAGLSVHTVSDRENGLGRLLDMLSVIWRLRHSYDVAHIDTFGGAAFLWAELSALLLRCLGKPYVLTLHGGSLPDSLRRFPRRVRRLLVGASCVTSPSDFMRQQFLHILPDIEVIPNPLFLDRYQHRERQAVKPRLIWLRAFHHVYAPLATVQAFAEIRKRVPAATLAMVGPDKGDGSLPQVRQLIADLGLDDSVEIIEGVANDDVGRLLSEYDILINTSRVDNAPVSLTEALACGLCVVSTPTGSIPEMLSNPRAGLVVPPNSPEAFADAIQRLLADPALVQEISHNARRAAEQYDSGPIFDRWATIFRHTAAKQ